MKEFPACLQMPRCPESKAAVSERAGFIDAPEINAKKNILQP
jgi:hypothetical protein